jgi:hypothetical protein
MQEVATALGLPSHMDAKNDIAPELRSREDHFGCPCGHADQWGSCIRLVKVDQSGLSTSSVLHLDHNEAALCMCLVSFETHASGQQMLAVGTAKDLRFYPRRAAGVCPDHRTCCLPPFAVGWMHHCCHMHTLPSFPSSVIRLGKGAAACSS